MRKCKDSELGVGEEEETEEDEEEEERDDKEEEKEERDEEEESARLLLGTASSTWPWFQPVQEEKECKYGHRAQLH